MPIRSATYDSGDICVCFSAPAETVDYGPGLLPDLEEIDMTALSIDSLCILGEDLQVESLPGRLQAAIRNLAKELEFQ